jgi:YfiH family protein
MAVSIGAWREKDGFLVHSGMTKLGLRHGFTTKRLGNMKNADKRRAAADLLGVAEPLFLKQVHGTVIHRAARSAQGLDGDGWTLGSGDEEGICVGVYVADCVPLYLWSDDGKYAGVFHAGWKGMAAGMPTKAVEALAERGARPESLRAAFGPHIGVDVYKVGPELGKSFPASSFSSRADGEHLDLHADARRQLKKSGLHDDSIGPVPPCTATQPDDFFSFRRDKQDARMLAVISL